MKKTQPQKIKPPQLLPCAKSPETKLKKKGRKNRNSL